MFYNGYADKGLCAAGGSHEGHGDDPSTFNFVLPHPITPSISLQAVLSDGRFVIVHGRGFTPNSGVTIDYHISSGGGPTTTTNGQENAETNVSGEFTSEIRVTLSGDIGAAGVRVRDNVTGTDATASI
jgi:hypothetical protein